MQHDDRRSDDATRLSGLDRLTQRAAVAVSRRGFLKRLSVLGAAVGLGAAVVRPAAAACAEEWDEYTTSSDGCGSCGYLQARMRDLKRHCCFNNLGTSCSSWSTTRTYCQYCG